MLRMILTRHTIEQQLDEMKSPGFVRRTVRESMIYLGWIVFQHLLKVCGTFPAGIKARCEMEVSFKGLLLISSWFL